MRAKRIAGWAWGLLILLLASCGGGGGGGEENAPGIVLSGVVEDGPLERARVSLRNRSGEILRVCGASGVGSCETLTRADGTFFLRVNEGALSHPLELVSNGGFDASTGVDFAGMPLRAPLEIFRGLEDRIVVTPLTSLLSARMEEGGNTASVGQALALDLGVAEGDFLARPSRDPELLSKTMVLTAIAMEMTASGKADDPFASLGRTKDSEGRKIEDTRVLVGGEPNPARLMGWGVDGAAEKHLKNLVREMQKGGDLARGFKKTALVKAVEKIAAAMLEEAGATDPDLSALHRNSEILAEKILGAASSTVIPLRGVVPQRLARYVLFSYGLTTPESFLADRSVFEGSLFHPDTRLPLEQDPRIGELASISALQSVSVPLLKSENPGDDNGKRLEYFYASDVSPFYLSEKLAGEMFDDRIGDQILSEVAHGKAKAGLLKEARAIADTQIFQDVYKAKIYRRVAEEQVKFGKTEEALQSLSLAESNLRAFVGRKGAGNLSTPEIQEIRLLGFTYYKAGDVQGSRRMLDYLRDMVPLNSTLSMYGTVIVTTWKLVDELVASGENEMALRLVDSMKEYALQTPPNTQAGKSFYRMKVLHLLETGKRYADLGLPDKAYEMYTLTQTIRANDGLQNLTASETWGYMDDFIEMLLRIGREAEAFALAEQIPTSSTGSTDRAAAFKRVATHVALTSGLDAAKALVEAQLPRISDQIEALTYFGIPNFKEPDGPYIALSYMQSGRMEEARRALELASSKVQALPPFSSELDMYIQLVQKGYVKIADLYWRLGYPEPAVTLLVKAQDAASRMIGIQYRVNSLVDIARCYDQLGSREEAVALLWSAAELVQQGSGIAAADSATMLRGLVDAGITIGEKETAARVLRLLSDTVGKIFDPATAYTGDNHDKTARKEVEESILAAQLALQAGDLACEKFFENKSAREVARTFLDGAAATAWTMRGPASRTRAFIDTDTKQVSIVRGFAEAGLLEEALALCRDARLGGSAARNLGFQVIAKIYSTRDDFPAFNVASIDFDGDGRPDFFHPLARPEEIASSGLVMDDDSDGDGIPNLLDRTPFFREVV